VSLEGKGGKGFGKKEGESGTQRLYPRRFFEGLFEFFKFNLCCYNIPNIKNILIKSIHLPFSTKKH
jgi:hypothetical protein